MVEGDVEGSFVQEEHKVNPESNPFREYLVRSITKLCKYDKGTALQLLDPMVDAD